MNVPSLKAPWETVKPQRLEQLCFSGGILYYQIGTKFASLSSYSLVNLLVRTPRFTNESKGLLKYIHSPHKTIKAMPTTDALPKTKKEIAADALYNLLEQVIFKCQEYPELQESAVINKHNLAVIMGKDLDNG